MANDGADVKRIFPDAVLARHRYDTRAFVANLRAMAVTPHLAQHTVGRRSAIDARTTRHPGYVLSQQKRKLVEQGFGWMKTIGGLRKLRHRGGLVTWIFTFTAAVCNIVRLRRLLPATHEDQTAASVGSAFPRLRGRGEFGMTRVDGIMNVTFSAPC
jgi:hypothetical protein